MRNFLKDKKLWCYISGNQKKPVDGEKKKDFGDELETWEVNNSKIITWINNSIENSIGM